MQKPHNSVVLFVSCIPRLGSYTTTLLYSPVMRSLATCGSSRSCGSAPSSFHLLFLHLLLLLSSLLFPHSLKLPAPPFPSTAQSQALFGQLEWGEGSHEIYMMSSEWSTPHQGSPSWGSRISIKVQTAPGQSTFCSIPFVQLKGSFLHI